MGKEIKEIIMKLFCVPYKIDPVSKLSHCYTYANTQREAQDITFGIIKNKLLDCKDVLKNLSFNYIEIFPATQVLEGEPIDTRQIINPEVKERDTIFKTLVAWNNLPGV